MKFISLFAGIGGFDLALERLGFECVYANDIDKYCKKVFDKHFETKLDTTDIRKVKEQDIPDHDLLVGGFPCQSFSIAGKRGGFEDTRGTLFFEVARILRHKRPRYFILENVRGLLNHDGGKTISTIFEVLSELGYELQWQVLNSKNFGVPQNRERVYIVGHLRGEPRPQVFPIGGGNQQDEKERILAHTLNASDWRGANRNQRQTTIMQINDPIHSNDRIYSPEGISPTLNTAQGGNRQPFIALSPETCYNGSNANATKTRPNKTLQVLSEVDSKTEIQQRRADEPTSFQEDAVLQQGLYEKGVQGSLQNGQAQMDGSSLQGKTNLHEVRSMRDLQRAEENGDTSQGSQRDKQQFAEPTGTMSGMPHEATSNTGTKDLIPQETKKRSWAIRRLTPLEAERLQGFPDGWTEGVSDTQRYKQCGNAVTVNVVEAVARAMFA